MREVTRFRLLVAGINWPPETFLDRLLMGLVEAGVQVTIGSSQKPDRVGIGWLPTPSWDAALPLRLARLTAMTIRAMLFGSRDLKLFSKNIRQSRGLAARLQVWNRLLPFAGHRWDVIYFPWNSASIACLPLFDLACPVVVSCRGTQVSVAPHNPARADLKEGLITTFKKAAAVHCVSEATRKDACRLGLDPAKAVVIHPAVDCARFRPVVQPPHNPVFTVLTVGTLIWVKGHEWALQAIRQVLDRGVNVRFEIIGDGPDRQRVLYTIADLELQDHVKWLGALKPEQVLTHLQQADCFLLSSHSEGISNAALEAMACGLPVVTTDCGGMREAVVDGLEGFVVPIRDAGAMAVAIERLAQDPPMRERMGQAARQRVEREFVSSRQICQWLDLYQAVLNHIGRNPNAEGRCCSTSCNL